MHDVRFVAAVAILFGAIAVLPGCGAASMAAAPSARTMQSVARRATGSGGDLVYALTRKEIVIVTYPAGSVVARIPVQPPGSAQEICSDPHNGNVFVNLYPGSIDEYAHGGTTPIATLSTSRYTPGGCSVDPVTGNLAVSAVGTGSKSPMLIYSHATGKPMLVYDGRVTRFNYPAYDGSGDLFASAAGKMGFRYAELKANSKAFSIIRPPSQFPFYVDAIQWDGSYIVFEDWNKRGTGVKLNQLKMRGKIATLVGVVSLQLFGGNAFWIQDRTVFGPFGKSVRSKSRGLAYWPYPGGGKPTSRFSGFDNGGEVWGVTVSVASTQRSPHS